MALMGVRKLMDYFYTQQDLAWLDHLLPEDDMRKQEDKGKLLESGVQLVAPQKRPVTVLSCHIRLMSSSPSFIVVLASFFSQTYSVSTVSVIYFAELHKLGKFYLSELII